MVYSDEELLNDIRSVADIVDRTPSLQDYRDHGSHGATTIYRRFGSWQDAVARAGFEPRSSQTQLGTDELIDALQKLADELGESPTSPQMRERGRYGPDVYRDRFGSWDDALDAAGLDPVEYDPGPRISDDELLSELRRLADARDDVPTRADMDADGTYNSDTYRRRFGSWAAALETAGFDPDRGPTDAELLADLTRLSEELDHRPTSTDVIDHGTYGLSTYERRFGSWREALAAAGFDPDANRPSDDALLADLHRLHEEREKVPSILDVEDDGEYSGTAYQNRFGSWSAALEAAGFDPDRGPTDAELLDELRRLRDDLEKQPSMRDMTDHGAYGTTTYVRHFGSWSAALEEAFEGEGDRNGGSE